MKLTEQQARDTAAAAVLNTSQAHYKQMRAERAAQSG